MGLSSARLLASALLAGCLVPAVAVAAADTVTLAPASPRVELPLGAPPPQEAILLVQVSDVRNPEMAPVSVLVTLQDADRKSPRVDLMRFALFPADRPGRFTGRADNALSQLTARLGARPGRLILGVEFDPAVGAAPARSQVELRLSAAWAATPGTGR